MDGWELEMNKWMGGCSLKVRLVHALDGLREECMDGSISGLVEMKE